MKMRFLFSFLLLLCVCVLVAQKGGDNNNPGNHQSGFQGQRGRAVELDTNAFHLIYIRFQKELNKSGEANLDSLRNYASQAIGICNSIDYTEGCIRIYLGLGSGFVTKATIDSAFYYNSLAIKSASDLRDTQLMAKAYLGYGWALVYNQSDYKGAIENILKADHLAHAIRDTALIIEIFSRLTRVYFQGSYISDAFRTCINLTELCKTRGDTTTLVYGLYMLGSIYGYMKDTNQMNVVYQALKLRRVKDNAEFLYRIYYTASNGYLFNKQYDSVLYYSRLNLKFCQELNRMPYCLTNIAKTFLETNQLDSARYYYNAIMDYHRAHNTYIDTYLYLDLGMIEYKSGNHQKALEYFQIAEADISKPSLTTQTEIYKALYTYFDFHQDFRQALYYHQKYKTWSDSILNKQFGKSALEYESSLLKEQNQSLSKEKEYQTVLAAKQRQEKNQSYAGMVLMLILVTWGFSWFRRQRNLRNKQIIIDERTRISRELHDEIGATLSGIAMYSHVAREQVKNAQTADAEHSLAFMQRSAGDMVHKLSDIVWLINPEQDTIIDLFGRLGEYGKQMTEVKGMQMKLDLHSGMSGLHIPFEARRNIYLFCKEAINNAVKYSNGKWVVLQVQSQGQLMVFSVSDDGDGFDAPTIRRGNGLSNMQRRAEEIGARFKLESTPDKGTRIELYYKIIH